jgi:adenylate cyclase
LPDVVLGRDRLRISAKLIDTETGHHLWASQFDGLLGDVFDLQDRLVASVVSAMRPTIQAAEIERARLKRPDNLQAYDYVLRALPGLRTMQDPEHEEATNLFHKAVEVEPDYALAIAMAAWAHGQRFGRVMRGDPEENRSKAIELANAALALAPNDPGVLVASVHALIHGALSDDLDRCEALLERALTLDPNSSSGWQRLGFLHVARSRPAEAIAAFERAIALGPLDPMQAYSRWGLGDAHFIAGRLSKALALYRRCMAEKPLDPGAKRRVCALLALTGKVEEARHLARSLLADHPQFTLARIAHAKPFEFPHVECYLEGLKRAGFS